MVLIDLVVFLVYICSGRCSILLYSSLISSLLQLTVDGEVVEVQRLFSDDLTLSELKVMLFTTHTTERVIQFKYSDCQF